MKLMNKINNTKKEVKIDSLYSFYTFSLWVNKEEYCELE